MAAFYYPKTITLNGIPVIIYPCTGLEKVFNRSEKHCLEDFVSQLYTKNKNLLHEKGQYNIVILWNDGNDRMADVWIYDKIESWGSGPLVDVKIFRNYQQETNIGVSAGDGLIMLGKEEEHRRTKASLDDYVKGDRPKLLAEIAPQEEFYSP